MSLDKHLVVYRYYRGLFRLTSLIFFRLNHAEAPSHAPLQFEPIRKASTLARKITISLDGRASSVRSADSVSFHSLFLYKFNGAGAGLESVSMLRVQTKISLVVVRRECPPQYLYNSGTEVTGQFCFSDYFKIQVKPDYVLAHFGKAHKKNIVLIVYYYKFTDAKFL